MKKELVLRSAHALIMGSDLLGGCLPGDGTNGGVFYEPFVGAAEEEDMWGILVDFRGEGRSKPWAPPRDWEVHPDRCAKREVPRPCDSSADNAAALTPSHLIVTGTRGTFARGASSTRRTRTQASA